MEKMETSIMGFWTPKVCRTIAFWPILVGLGLLVLPTFGVPVLTGLLHRIQGKGTV